LALDRICFFESYTSFGIAPWNPGTGLSFVLIFGIWPAAYSIAVRRPLISGCHQSRSSLCWKKQEGSRSRLYSRQKPTGLDHADLDKFVVNRLRFSASAPSWKTMVADYGSTQFREGHRYASHYR